MCAIIILDPGYTLPFEMLENATHNNPHGYGLVLRDPVANRLQVIKSGKESLEKGNDPEEIYSLLKEHEDIERYLHVRWKTEGSISLENIQPFCAYHSSKREIYFMHNGTLHDYKPPTSYGRWENGVQVEKASEIVHSDTYRFNEQVLIPVLSRFQGEKGKGDILDPVFSTIVTKFWGNSPINRGLLISSDQGPLLINERDWKKIKTTSGEFYASNDTYFDKLVRGPVYEKREKERKKQEAAQASARFQKASKKDSVEITKLKDVLLSDKFSLPINIKHLMQDVDVYSEEGLASLKNVTAMEWEDFLNKNQDDNVALLIHFTDEFAKLFEKYTKASSYLDKLNKERGKEKRVG